MEIEIKINDLSPFLLDCLRIQFAQIGIHKFHIDYMDKKVIIDENNQLSIEEIQAAIWRAGYHRICTCKHNFN